MLTFVGIGISGASDMSDPARESISAARTVYVERFTSIIHDDDMGMLERIATSGGATLKSAARWMVEDGQEILDAARKENVVLVCYGDPYIATTHIELRVRAELDGIRTRSIHGVSALTSMVGECGLHQYKLGRTSTVTREEASTPYSVLRENLQRACHTVLLLEYDQDSSFFLEPHAALESLLAVEDDSRFGVFTRDTFAIVASRVGFDDQLIHSGAAGELLGVDFGKPPHSIIVPGSLHFTETDALRALTKCSSEPRPNYDSAKKESHRMLAKYVPMIRETILQMREGADDDASRVLDNAQNYVDDASEFLKTGRDELAILTIGYADGLVDALRIHGNLPYRVQKGYAK